MPSCKPLLSGDRPVLYQLLPFGAMAKHRDRSRSPPGSAQEHTDTLGIAATSLSGETMALEFDSAATMRDLRRILARRLGAPEHGVSILVGNEKLCDMTKLLRDACGDGHVTVLKCSRPWLLAPTGLGTGRYSLDSQDVGADNRACISTTARGKRHRRPLPSRNARMFRTIPACP